MEAVAERESKVRLGREVIAISSGDVNVMPWPQDLASGVIGPGRGPATNLSHNQNRKQTGAVIAQLRQGSFDRIFPSEHEIAPTVSNKTEEGSLDRCLVFFSHSPPPLNRRTQCSLSTSLSTYLPQLLLTSIGDCHLPPMSPSSQLGRPGFSPSSRNSNLTAPHNRRGPSKG